jgi:hypothetical protein
LLKSLKLETAKALYLELQAIPSDGILAALNEGFARGIQIYKELIEYAEAHKMSYDDLIRGINE